MGVQFHCLRINSSGQAGHLQDECGNRRAGTVSAGRSFQFLIVLGENADLRSSVKIKTT